MTPITSGTVIQATAGTVLTPGTVTSTGIDFTTLFEPNFSYIAQAGAISSGGTLVAHIQQSAAVSSGYASIGSATFVDAAGGTVVQTVDIDATQLTQRYVRSLLTCVGGTVSGGVGASIVAKARTITD